MKQTVKKRVEKDEWQTLRQQGWNKDRKEKKRDGRKYKEIRVERLRTRANGTYGGEESKR